MHYHVLPGGALTSGVKTNSIMHDSLLECCGLQAVTRSWQQGVAQECANLHHH